MNKSEKPTAIPLVDLKAQLATLRAYGFDAAGRALLAAQENMRRGGAPVMIGR